jgi:hypothetical protein
VRIVVDADAHPQVRALHGEVDDVAAVLAVAVVGEALDQEPEGGAGVAILAGGVVLDVQVGADRAGAEQVVGAGGEAYLTELPELLRYCWKTIPPLPATRELVGESYRVVNSFSSPAVSKSTVTAITGVATSSTVAITATIRFISISLSL